MNVFDEIPFQFYSIYYDLIYNAKNYFAEAEYVSALIKKVNPNAKKILELGCGTGNHATFFSEIGFNVVGLERSNFMLKQAEAKNIENFSPFAGDMRNFEINEKFDAVVALFHVFSYLNNDSEIMSCFSSVAKHLPKNGLFIFDTWHTDAVEHQKPEPRVKEVEDDFYKVVRHADPTFLENSNIVEVSYEIMIEEKATSKTHLLKEVHRMRHFSTKEIENFALKTGFVLLNSKEILSGEAPSNKTWGVCYTLQKQ